MTPSKASPDALAGAVVRAVAGWTDPPHRLTADLRADLLAALPHLLVDTPDCDEYLRQLRAARRASGRVADLNAAAERLELPTDGILRDGLGGLTDEHLAVLAVEPLLLTTLAALIEEVAEASDLGPAWWQAMDRAGRASVAGPLTPDPALLARYRAVAALPRDDLYATAADVVRAVAPSDLLAGGTAQEFVRQWADGRFAAVCVESEPDGPLLLAALTSGDDDPAALAIRVAEFLRRREVFAAVSTGRLAALAVAVVAALREPG